MPVISRATDLVHEIKANTSQSIETLQSNGIKANIHGENHKIIKNRKHSLMQLHGHTTSKKQIKNSTSPNICLGCCRALPPKTLKFQ